MCCKKTKNKQKKLTSVSWWSCSDGATFLDRTVWSHLEIWDTVAVDWREKTPPGQAGRTDRHRQVIHHPTEKVQAEKRDSKEGSDRWGGGEEQQERRGWEHQPAIVWFIKDFWPELDSLGCFYTINCVKCATKQLSDANNSYKQTFADDNVG